jgi:hypothetical protein
MHGLMGAAGTGASTTVTEVAQPAGKPQETGLGTYRRATPPRQSPTLHGRFYPSRIVPLLQRINTYLMRWAGMKYKRLRSYKRFKAWWFGIIDRDPDLFAHWRMVRTFAGLR